MLATIDSINRFSAAWAGLMGAILWQSALLVAVVTLAALLLGRASPRVRFWLWQIVAVKLLLMPFWVVAVPLPLPVLHGPAADQPDLSPTETLPPAADRRAVPPSAVVPAPEADPLPAPVPAPGSLAMLSWWSWLLLTWACVVVGRIVWIARQRYLLGRVLHLTTPAQEGLADRVREFARRLGLRREPSVLLVDSPDSLFVCGFRRPMLVLPTSLPASLGPAELEQVVLHELAHLRRGDLYWGWTIELARTLYFFNPVVYWVAYCLHLERELACDQVAMTVSGHTPGDYAQTLVRVASHASEPAPSQVAAMTGRKDKPGPPDRHS